MSSQKRFLHTLVLLILLGTGSAIASGKFPNPSDLVQKETQPMSRMPAKVLAKQQVEDDFRPLAKIMPEQAKEAAQKFLPGKVTEIDLENEDGNLVYEVTIAQTEVYVDAGNGKVLFTEGVDVEDEDVTPRERPRSSIQVAHREVGDD